ncbi:MAG: HD domain-containing phosphohydrolase [Dehalococcoidia bacterium]
MTRHKSPIAGEEGLSPAELYSTSDVQEGTFEPGELPLLSKAELISGFSEGLDLAEGRAIGHASRVCYIAGRLAQSLELPEADQAALHYASLLHDLGVPLVSPELSDIIGVNENALFAASPRKSPEELAADCRAPVPDAIIGAFHRHASLGGAKAIALGLSTPVGETIASSHENWDGSGYPEGLAAHDIPLLSRVLAMADWAESVIAEEQNSLVARRSLTAELEDVSEMVLDPKLVEQVKVLSRSDDFWLGLFGKELSRSLLARRQENGRWNWKAVMSLAKGLAEVIDSKSRFTQGKSARVSEIAGQLAEAIGLSSDHVQVIRLAALLHDIGQLSVPARIMGKPDILTLTEMQLMQRHPSYSRLILENLSGMEEAAQWVGGHHERPDGKGYPEMLGTDLIPLESRIIAVANVYVALTSDRPYRRALSEKDALKVMTGAAGTQLDAHLVHEFRALH